MAATSISTKSDPPLGPWLSGNRFTRSWRTIEGSRSSAARDRMVRLLMASIAARAVASMLIDTSTLAGVRQVCRCQRFERHADRHAFRQSAADALAEDERYVAVRELGP